MIDVIITMKDGEVKEFLHKGRAGGSYSKSVRYEVGFVIVIDEWYNETAIPSADIREVKINNMGSKF